MNKKMKLLFAFTYLMIASSNAQMCANYYYDKYFEQMSDVNYQYSPSTCTVTNYDFTLLFDKNDGVFKVHGLWPEQCTECEDCPYPSCCNMDNVYYEYPEDPTNFIQTNWFNSYGREECLGLGEVILFEHEFYKHISCTNIGNTSNFLNLVMRLYNKYNDNITSCCTGHEQMWINIDGNFNYNKVKCM